MQPYRGATRECNDSGCQLAEPDLATRRHSLAPRSRRGGPHCHPRKLCAFAQSLLVKPSIGSACLTLFTDFKFGAVVCRILLNGTLVLNMLRAIRARLIVITDSPPPPIPPPAATDVVPPPLQAKVPASGHAPKEPELLATLPQGAPSLSLAVSPRPQSWVRMR